MGKALIFAAFVALAACQTTGGDLCQTSHPIRLSSEAIDALSDAEVAAVLAHNKKGQALCHWSP